MAKVLKKNGSSEDFQREKIVKACMGCGAQEDVAKKIAGEIETQTYEGMPTTKIREMVLSKLSAVNPQFKENWIKHEATKTAK